METSSMEKGHGNIFHGFLEKLGSELGQLALLSDLSTAAGMPAPPQSQGGQQRLGSGQCSAQLTGKNPCR